MVGKIELMNAFDLCCYYWNTIIKLVITCIFLQDLVCNVLLIISSIVQLYVGIYLSVVFTRIILKYRRQNVR